MALVLTGLAIGGIVGYSIRRRRALVPVILLPLPMYLGIALGFWGNGFGENWQYGIVLWAVPVIVGYLLGGVAGRNLDSRGVNAGS
jgi:hypothetical protein